MKIALVVGFSMIVKFLAMGVALMSVLGAPPIPSRLWLAFVLIGLDLVFWAYLVTTFMLANPKPEPLPTDCEELAELANDAVQAKRMLAYRERQLARILKIVGGSDDTNT